MELLISFDVQQRSVAHTRRGAPVSTFQNVSHASLAATTPQVGLALKISVNLLNLDCQQPGWPNAGFSQPLFLGQNCLLLIVLDSRLIERLDLSQRELFEELRWRVVE